MTLSWNQPMCERDWIAQRGVWEGDRLVSLEKPVGLTREYIEVEQCAWCGEPTIFGVFVRANPANVRFPAEKEE